jgi:hypothetical protein
LPQLSLRLEDIDHRRTGVRHRNPRTGPCSRAEQPGSCETLLDRVKGRRYLVVNVLPICGAEIRSDVECVVLLKFSGFGVLASFQVRRTELSG